MSLGEIRERSFVSMPRVSPRRCTITQYRQASAGYTGPVPLLSPQGQCAPFSPQLNIGSLMSVLFGLEAAGHWKVSQSEVAIG